MSSWKCQDCGAVWAGWFPGPCNHPIHVAAITDADWQQAKVPHPHEYEGYATTGGSRCRICGRTPPEIPNTTINQVFT